MTITILMANASKRLVILSNFWTCRIVLLHNYFNSIEAAFQAAKCANPGDMKQFTSLSPSAAKQLGNKITIRANWNNMRIPVMRFLLRQKFRPGSQLANMLLATGERQLIEGNSWRDTYWGVSSGVGENNLGKLLMEIRRDLRDNNTGEWVL